MRIAPLGKTHGISVRWRPFLLGPIFKSQGWNNSPFNLYPAKGRYMWRDLERVCGALGLPFAQPSPFPQNSVLAARIALVGLAQSWGEDFCRAIYRAEFGEGRNIAEPATAAAVLVALDQDAKAIFQAAQTAAVKNVLRSN